MSIRSCLLLSTVLSFAAQAADWPRWRGIRADGWTDQDPLPELLPVPAAPVWRRNLGPGYAAPVVAGGMVVVLDDTNGREYVRALDRATGNERWHCDFAEGYADEFEPGPRCTPLIDENRVFVQSCRGEFACVSMEDGKIRWRFHFRDYGTFWVPNRQSGVGAANRRGNTGSPVIWNDLVIVQVGSTNDASLCAFDKATGNLRWKSQKDLTTYSSLALGTLAGVPQVVAATCEGLMGLACESGSLQWRVPFATAANRKVLTPIIDGDTVNFASHSTGMRRVRIHPSPSLPAVAETPMRTTQEWLNPRVKINLATPVLVGDQFYGMGGSKDYVCVDRKSGNVLWSQPGFDAMASSLTDGKRILVLDDKGECRLITPDTRGFREAGRFQACGKTFVHPAYSNGILFTRDNREMVAWNIRNPR